MNPRKLTLMFSALLAICGPLAAEVYVMDYSKYEGAYIIGFTAHDDLRRMFEDQLVADLAARSIKAFPSYPDQPDIAAMTRENVIEAAHGHSAMFVLVAEQVVRGETGVVGDPQRMSHQHPGLAEFYEHSKPPEGEYDASSEVFVEVTVFLLQGDDAKSVWAGTTWSFQADGQGGAIPGISETIAREIAKARRNLRR